MEESQIPSGDKFQLYEILCTFYCFQATNLLRYFPMNIPNTDLARHLMNAQRRKKIKCLGTVENLEMGNSAE